MFFGNPPEAAFDCAKPEMKSGFEDGIPRRHLDIHDAQIAQNVARTERKFQFRIIDKVGRFPGAYLQIEELSSVKRTTIAFPPAAAQGLHRHRRSRRRGRDFHRDRAGALAPRLRAKGNVFAGNPRQERFHQALRQAAKRRAAVLVASPITTPKTPCPFRWTGRTKTT